MRLEFLPKQREFLEATESEVLYSGAYGAGKSVALCAKAVFLALRYPRNRIFIGRKILQNFMSTTYKTLLQGDGDLPPILPSHYIENHNKTLRTITLINGSEIIYDGVDVEKIKSLNLGAVFIDECGELTEEEWIALGGRLRLAGMPVYQLCGSTNPYSEYHFLYNRFKVNPVRDLQGNLKVKFVQTKMSDNYHLPKEYVDRQKTTLFGHFYDRYVLGLWVGADSTVYDNFRPDTHIIPSFEIPKSWKRYRAVDFGFRSPFTCGWFAVVPEEITERNLKVNDVILYKEMYYTERTTTVNANQINNFSVYPDKTKEVIIYTVADWDSGDRADLEAVGIKTIKANKKDKLFRIQKVRHRLGNSDPNRGQMVKPSFFLFDNSLLELDPKIRIDISTGEQNNDPTRASEEFMAYSWKPNKKGVVNDEPEDKYDHAMDMISYFFAEYDTGGIWKDIPFSKV